MLINIFDLSRAPEHLWGLRDSLRNVIMNICVMGLCELHRSGKKERVLA
jgi:hypothetical protein